MVYESQLTTGQLALQSCQEYACGTPAELTALGHLGWACPRSDSLNDGSMQPSYLTPSKMYGKTQGHIEVDVVDDTSKTKVLIVTLKAPILLQTYLFLGTVRYKFPNLEVLHCY